MQQRSLTRAAISTKLASVKHKVKLAYNLFTPYKHMFMNAGWKSETVKDCRHANILHGYVLLWVLNCRMWLSKKVNIKLLRENLENPILSLPLKIRRSKSISKKHIQYCRRCNGNMLWKWTHIWSQIKVLSTDLHSTSTVQYLFWQSSRNNPLQSYNKFCVGDKIKIMDQES